jgi:SAM-dependent methyltransferase
MRLVLAAVALAACAHAAPAPVTAAAPPPAPAPAKPPPPSEASIKQRSHEVLDAFDRGDAAALEAALSPRLVHFEGGEPESRTEILDSVKKRKTSAMYIAKRTWDKEKVTVRDDDAVFVGLASEEQGGNTVHGGGYLYTGWYMLQWVRDGADWRLAVWTWQRKPPPGEGWNEIYRNGRGFNREPNKLLADSVRGAKTGRALDLACGQGRNALYLASQGWKVTGVDIADEGLRLAREAAAGRKLAFEAINADLDTWDMGTDRWDLITMIYAGSEKKWIERIKPALRKGGLYVVEFFANEDPAEKGGFRPGELAKLFGEGFEVLRDEVVDDVPDWAMDRAKLVRFVARKR